MLVVIAVCARPYAVAAAQAGYQVAAFDAFNDVETRRFCVRSTAVHYSNGGFDADDLWQNLVRPDDDVTGIVYGSGLENQPEVLQKIALRYPLIGNSPQTVAQVKDPQHFFPLLGSLSIRYPEVVSSPPQDAEQWLIKRAGGSGGTHIRMSGRHQAGDYFQRKVVGKPVSLLFLADGRQAQIVGFNEQWCAPTKHMPYRYGGAVSRADLPDAAKARMAEAAQKVTAASGLRGLNSMDFMCIADDVLALEVNPRLTATFDLYDDLNLFERHLQACSGWLTAFPETIQSAKAHSIVYASHTISIPDGFAWPAWVMDTPYSTVMRDQPLCTVLAGAADANTAKSLAFARVRQLEAQLNPFYEQEELP